MIAKLLTEHHLEFLSLKGGCRGVSESALVKMSNCWKSYVAAHIIIRTPVRDKEDKSAIVHQSAQTQGLKYIPSGQNHIKEPTNKMKPFI